MGQRACSGGAERDVSRVHLCVGGGAAINRS